MEYHSKKIIFRADGNSTTGLGHLYRLFALVEMLKNQFETTFITSETSTAAIIPKDYNLKIIPKSITIANEPTWMSSSFTPSETIIIADGYQFDSNYQKELCDLGFNLVYIDDLVSENMFAQVVVNHAYGISANQYSSVSNTRFALGTNYAILRPEFLRAIENKRTIGTIEEVFVCFGGADSLNLTEKVVQCLKNLDQIKKINIVLGGANKFLDNNLFYNEDSRCSIYRNVSAEELVGIMAKCQLAIVPSSTILYEVCAVQIPVISGYYVDNQKGIYNGFLKKGAIIGVGDFKELTNEALTASLLKIINSTKHELNHQINQQRLLFDSKIVERYQKLIKSLC